MKPNPSAAAAANPTPPAIVANPALPFTLDCATRTVLLSVDVVSADPASFISLPEAARLLRGRGGKPPHVNTLRRWASRRKGWHVLLSVDGQEAVWTLRLPVARLSADLVTTREAVQAFERVRLRLSAVTPQTRS